MLKATATKSIRKNTIIAQNKPLGLLERITLSPDTRAKFTDVGKRKPVPQPVSDKVYTRPLTEEEKEEIATTFLQDCVRKTILSKLLTESHALEDRIKKNRAEEETRSLLERMEVTPRPEYQAPEPIPEKLHFKKRSTVARQPEVWKKVESTKKRLDPLFKRLDDEDSREDAGLSTQVPLEVRDKCWKVFNDLQDIYDDYDEYTRRWGTKQWRYLMGACKRIGKVEFRASDLSTRLPDICKELAQSNVQFPSRE